MELHQFTHSTVEQWWPDRTCSRNEEWEAALGLPDACIGAVTDPVFRREVLLSRLRGPSLPYADSSPAGLGVIAQLCAGFGYTVNVFYDAVLRCGRDGVGQRLGSTGLLFVDMSSMCSPMRVGSAGVGERLVECSNDPQVLLCLLQRVVPARFDLRLFVDGEMV